MGKIGLLVSNIFLSRATISTRTKRYLKFTLTNRKSHATNVKLISVKSIFDLIESAYLVTVIRKKKQVIEDWIR